jgi:hypothetical protein
LLDAPSQNHPNKKLNITILLGDINTMPRDTLKMLGMSEGAMKDDVEDISPKFKKSSIKHDKKINKGYQGCWEC